MGMVKLNGNGRVVKGNSRVDLSNGMVKDHSNIWVSIGIYELYG